jgi:acetoacetyl-CoA synthetase
MEWLAGRGHGPFADYEDLWRWSVADLNGFWLSIWGFLGLDPSHPPDRALGDARMPGAEWFPGISLNYAERALSLGSTAPAVIHASETRPLTYVDRAELRDQVGAAAAGLRRIGVRPGDRVVSIMPNIFETVVAFLATASIGAVWSGVSPDFGSPSILDRFVQIEPSVLFAVDGYVYGGKPFDRRAEIAEIRSKLPSLKGTVVVPYLDAELSHADLGEGMLLWDELLEDEAGPSFEAVPFSHPLWVLFSSGTTGSPKGIVHGHGGIVVEHMKIHSLHFDLGPEDRFFWFSTTGWMMWNFLLGGLLQGCSIVLYDGNPVHPDPMRLWRLAEEAEITYFGTSAPFIESCMTAGLRPGREVDLTALRSIGSTASPLSVEAFGWVYEDVKQDVALASASGGTDICSGFVGPCPLSPVRAGEIQCRMLGASVKAFNDRGAPVYDEVGELVVTEPMPSMPLYFWNDPDRKRYQESYFETFPGVWRHGDWIRIKGDGSCVISGRSDSTIKRSGIRTGTSEFYRLIEAIPEVADSLVIDLDTGGRARLLLFVQIADGSELSETLRETIRERIRTGLSPRHVPDEIVEVPGIPRTLNGKKLEVPIKRILLGAPVDDSVSRDALADPDALRPFEEMGRHARPTQKEVAE